MNYYAYMKNIYVHLGYPKTDSTFIQKEIFPQFKSFKIYNISFNKKLKIFDIFFLDEKKFNMCEDKLINFINIEFKNNKNFIITNENFLHKSYFSNITIDKLIKRFKKIFPKKSYNLNFFFFIRKPVDFIPSYYSEYYRDIIKIDNNLNYYDKFLISLKSKKFFYKYFNFSRIYQKLFKETNRKCKVFLFEDMFFDTKNFKKEFAKYFNFKNFRISLEQKKIYHLTKKISKNEYERKRVPIHKLFKKKKILKNKKLLNIIYRIFTVDKVAVNKKNSDLILNIFKNIYKDLPKPVLKKIYKHKYFF